MVWGNHFDGKLSMRMYKECWEWEWVKKNRTHVVYLYLYRRLGVKSGGASVYHKTNRESMVEIGDSIRGKDIYIIQTGAKYV